MLKDGGNSGDNLAEVETSQKNLEDRISDENVEVEGEKSGICGKGINLLIESEMGLSKFSNDGNFSSTELTLKYLCDNPKLNFLENVDPGKNYVSGKSGSNGNQVLVEDRNRDVEDNRWVERDFLQLNGNSLKRKAKDEENCGGNREKMPKTETPNLSLALPALSFDTPSLNPAGNNEILERPRPIQSTLAPSNDNVQTTYSNDFATASFSHSFSLPFSHNPSCSLTLNSTENYEHSLGSHRKDCDKIWNCDEGTNGSVHSRFRPLGDGVLMSNKGDGGGRTMQAEYLINKDSKNSYCRTSTSDNSFFPSELPARPLDVSQYADPTGKGFENFRGAESLDETGVQKLSRPEKILRDIVIESIPVMAHIIEELPSETVESTKDYLKSIIVMPKKSEELIWLQNWLGRRLDLTHKSLSKSHRIQLEILVAIKMGLENLLSKQNVVSMNELVEIFFLERCPNAQCTRLLPVDDCECKICSTKKGFCSECMCPICFKFDSANNTCSWVGCDACSHWCHATCGIQNNVIRPGSSLKGPAGTTEAQFHCPACGHASEMYGFVKDVFMSFAKKWNSETLIKELDFVKKIFHGSNDIKEQQLHIKVDEILTKLESKIFTPSDACNSALQFFNCTESLLGATTSRVYLNDHKGGQSNERKDVAAFQPADSISVKSSFFPVCSSIGRQELMPVEMYPTDINASPVGNNMVEDEGSVKHSKKDGISGLETVVQMKEAEARMYQTKADEARREADRYKRIVRKQSEKLKEEYAEKLDKLCLKGTEEKRKKMMEELRSLEIAHYDYCNLKTRMQAEITSMLKRMEVTKQQLI